MLTSGQWPPSLYQQLSVRGIICSWKRKGAQRMHKTICWIPIIYVNPGAQFLGSLEWLELWTVEAVGFNYSGWPPPLYQQKGVRRGYSLSDMDKCPRKVQNQMLDSNDNSRAQIMHILTSRLPSQANAAVADRPHPLLRIWSIGHAQGVIGAYWARKVQNSMLNFNDIFQF